jgi:Flp pilus assembly pilin Flp
MIAAGFSKLPWLFLARRGERGQTLVEYSLILAFVASMIVALGVVVGGTNGLLDDIQSALDTALGG